jgi:outer membrane protein OmpA-like peptidoglycan-associated protein
VTGVTGGHPLADQDGAVGVVAHDEEAVMTRSGFILIAVALLPGCATHKYVTNEVGDVKSRVNALNEELERTQARTTKNETRIEEVDRQSQTGVADARGSAARAMKTAQDAEHAAKGKLLYTLTLSTDQVRFAFDKADLSDDAKKVVSETLAPIIADNRGVYLEIEGHTDATGPTAYNKKLGEDRAVAMRDYLHDQLGIALSRMEVISYGASKPLADNKTSTNRAMNRRVVINVLE